MTDDREISELQGQFQAKLANKHLSTKDFLVVTLETYLELTYGNIIYNDIKD